MKRRKTKFKKATFDSRHFIYKRMKSQKLWFVSAFILTIFISSTAQTPDITHLIEETKKNAIATANLHYGEFASDWKRSVVKVDGKMRSQTFELICSNKHCEHIKVEENGKNFSDKKIRKNRRKASKTLSEYESAIENQTDKRNEHYGYSFSAATVFSQKYGSIFSPFLYLKHCQSSFLETQKSADRKVIKIRSSKCSINGEAKEDVLLFLPQTEAVIWIDERDKTVVKFEVFRKFENDTQINFDKPLIVAETAKVADGGWFWKKVTINGIGNERFFPDDYGNWQIDFFNYKKFNVDIEKVEVNNKSN